MMVDVDHEAAIEAAHAGSRQVGQRLQLKRVPELTFLFDEAIEKSDRIERILQVLNTERADRPDIGEAAGDDTTKPRDDDQ
jgi:ribosome-binding factor A